VRLKNNKFAAIIVISIWILGIICGLFLGNLPYFTFKSETSLGELSNFFLAFVIAFILNSKLNNKRNEKDLLIEACKNVNDKLLNVKEFIDNNCKPGRKISDKNATLVKLKLKHNNKLVSILSENLVPYQSNSEIAGTISSIRSNHNAYWTKISADLGGNYPKITQGNYLEAEDDFYSYLSNISTLILLLNND
jgi:hypothetical protein